jgi:diguanylate cyclase (GGDEF)-like protein
MIIDEFYRNILESLPQVVLVATPLANPETGETDLLIEFVNSAWERVVGSRIQTVLGKFFSQTIYARSEIPWVGMAEEAVRGRREQHHTLYSSLLDKWLDIHVLSLESGHLCLHFADVSEIKQGEMRLKEQNLRLSSLSAELAASKSNLKVKLEKIENLNANLEQLAYYDRLTTLPNRIRFNEILAEEIDSAQRSGQKVALAIFDIDNLKNLNDSQGHESGDELLRQIAQRLSHFERGDVRASRFGGDEFLILIRNYEHDAELLHIVNRVQEVLREPYLVFNAELKSTVSIGVATFPEDASNLKDLLKFADIAMTDAKRRGKNTVSLFHSVMQEDLLARIVMERKMVKTLEEGGFKVFYQPQFDAESGRLRGFEALVRWFDDELGYVSPERFIPIAEETRAIIPLGDWILRTACRTLADWQRDFGFDGVVSINVSPIQLQHTLFVDDLTAAVRECGIRPGSLEVEVTEGVLIRNFDESVLLLRKIREIGVGVSLDDFGTGYSSLRYLQHLPLNALKIDKSFVANIARGMSVEFDITEAIVTLVNKLGFDTIAEGVETEAQLDVIRRIKCKTVQGFLTGRPMPREECERLIAADRARAAPVAQPHASPRAAARANQPKAPSRREPAQP